jgi:hypothetical protein
MNLKQAADHMSRSTGRVFLFLVATMKADGSEKRDESVSVIALDTADAWGLLGDALERFMHGPNGRWIRSIQIQHEPGGR